MESVLTKSLLKNPINPGARYAWSLLYYDTAYYNHHLDSAHSFIEHALKDAALPDSLGGLALEKSGLTYDDLLSQKSTVDSAAFIRAVDLNTVQGFQYFIDHYQKSVQSDSAISNRNYLAFEIAASTDTFESYKEFLDQYPDAQQAPKAKDRYQLLVFESKTGSGKLQQLPVISKGAS